MLNRAKPRRKGAASGWASKSAQAGSKSARDRAGMLSGSSIARALRSRLLALLHRASETWSAVGRALLSRGRSSVGEAGIKWGSRRRILATVRMPEIMSRRAASVSDGSASASLIRVSSVALGAVWSME